MTSLIGKVRGAEDKISSRIGAWMDHWGFSMRTKLIALFLIVKIIPLIILLSIAWIQFYTLGDKLSERMDLLAVNVNSTLTEVGETSANDSTEALNASATENIERMSTDVAQAVANFLYKRDFDLRVLADLSPSQEAFQSFITENVSPIVNIGEWELAPDGSSWIQKNGNPIEQNQIASSNPENDVRFNYRPPENLTTSDIPLYNEITYIDLNGKEQIKVTSGDRMNSELLDITVRTNTYAKAETYWEDLTKLQPGEIYVSDVIGTYVPSKFIGMYTPDNLEEAGVEYNPENDAFAGKENPIGKRFEGIVRWAMPVTENGTITGYITMALNHDHLMAFTDNITPMQERYISLPSAYEGNYAFIWDYECRNICHPRHHSIYGFDPETGDPQVPWLEESIYQDWKASGLSYIDFIKTVPTFHEQSREKSPAPELTKQGLVGLDGRYLNNAPQCTGWMDLTSEGGSGSFTIVWSGLEKLTTAATIPYYTGKYANTKRGFGFVTIGAGLEDFQRPAIETAENIDTLIQSANDDIVSSSEDAKNTINGSLVSTTLQLVISTIVIIIIVILIAIWMASFLANNINLLIVGLNRFRHGERQFRFNSKRKDEFGELANSFDEMANSVTNSVQTPLAILDNDLNIIYINQIGLTTIKREFDEVEGKPYPTYSMYPFNTEYCPITALRNGTEASEFFNTNDDKYYKGSGQYLLDNVGERIGYIVTSTDVTEMALNRIRLEQAVEAANSANKHKGDFLARMSHEIRTPMNAIIGITQIVEKKLDANNAKDIDINGIRRHVEQIDTSSKHLLGLLNDVLDISKIEAGKIEILLEPVNLHKLADTVYEIIKPRCDDKRISLNFDFDNELDGEYISDSLRLRQVLINLLGNAVKFTPELATVAFKVEKIGDDGDKTIVKFSVEDTGIGISEDAISTIFKPFEQGDGSISREFGGTGLGLPISRRIVNLLGSDITVSSNLGKGSVFSFELTLEKVDSAPESLTRRHSRDEVSFKGKRILIVDDVDINRMIAGSLLEETGIEIVEACDGEEAIEIIDASTEGTYDIILMDVMMPKMNGLQASKVIRSLDREDTKNIPIIALTANAFQDDIEKALKHGMNAHLAKPIEAGKLIEVIYTHLNMDE